MHAGILDDEVAITKIDRENMLQVLEQTPEEYWEGYEAALACDSLPHALARPPTHIALMGMGGSAIAADVLKDWLFDAQTVIEVIRGPILPGSVTAGTHLLVASYSGQTTEALKALKEARRRKTRVSAIASEGDLLTICREYGIPHVQVKAGLQPREALPHLFSASLAVLDRWGMCGRKSIQAELNTVTERLRELRKKIGFARSESSNPAKQLAVRLEGTIPFVYAPQLMASAARRFKNQLNENSKVLAKFEILPEMLHNEVQSWHMLKDRGITDAISFVFLRGCEGEDEAEQFKRLKDLIESGGRVVHEIAVKSPTRLAAILETIYYCDYVSFYLAVVRGVDPTPIDTIQSLKRCMRSSAT